jgi:hypothetical protein
MRHLTKNRHGLRKPGTVLITFPVDESLKRTIGRIAFDDGHTVSEWIRIQLRNVVRRSQAARKARAA